MAINKTQILQAAQSYMAKGQLEKAIEEWQKLITESPNDGNIYNTIGDIHLKMNNLPLATDDYLKAAEAFHTAGFALKTLAVYKKILKLNPKRYDVYLKLGDINAERGLAGNAIEDYLTVAKHYSQDGRIKEALEVYRKIANLDPTNTNIRLKLAEMCLKEGYEDQAVAELLQVAKVYQEAGQVQEAEGIYERVLKLNPQNTTARIALGMESSPEDSVRQNELLSKAEEAFEKGMYDQAEPLLRQLTTADPTNPLYQEKIGYLFLKKGQQFMAFTALKSATQGYIQRGEASQVVKLMRDYLAVDPDQIEAHQLLATALEKEGDLPQAIAEYARVIDEYLAMRDLAQANPLYEKIKALNPEHRDVKRLSLIFEGRTAEAPSPSASLEPTFLQIQKEASPKSPGPEPAPLDEAHLKTLFTEAEIYIKYGLISKAIEQLDQILASDPNNIQAHLRLKECYQVEGNPSLAAEECLKLAKIYKERGETEESAKAMEEAHALGPNHPFPKEEADLATPPLPSHEPIQAQTELSIPEEIKARMAEADLYLQRGLLDEATKLYELILALKPDHPDAQAKLSALTAEGLKPSGAQDQSVEEAAIQEELDRSFASIVLEEPPATPPVSQVLSESSLPEEPPAEGEGFVNLSEMVQEEIKEASTPSKPVQDRDQELRSLFKERGTEMEGRDVDYETHYNLGIAYKEMGLIDEAIAEFKLSVRSQDRFIDSCNMLADCFQQKGMIREATQVLEQALADPGCRGFKRRWLSYELALLYEQNGPLEAALKLYDEISHTDPNFKDVAQRLDLIRKAVGKHTTGVTATEKPEEKDEDIEFMMEKIIEKSPPGSRSSSKDRKAHDRKKGRISYL